MNNIKKTGGQTIQILFFFLFLLAWLLPSQAQSLRQFTPGQLWPDNKGVHVNAHGGGILFYRGKYYWFGEHKIAGEKGNKAYVGVHCYSSVDLYNWKDEGIALQVEKDPLSKIAAGSVIERPKVIYNKTTRQFVMWTHLELKGMGYKAALCAVATSDKITGPYKLHHTERPDRQSWPLNYKGEQGRYKDSILKRDFSVGQMSRDMNLFVDDDDKAYLIYTSEENSTLHISLLSDDYLNTTGKYVRVFAGRYMEGAAIFKNKHKYYFVASGCTGWAPNAARSAVADSLFGQWTELGNPCVGKDSALTFHGQSNFVLKVNGRKNDFIFMADRWNPKNAIDGRYIWLPVNFQDGKFSVPWKDHWNLKDFK